jgi:hypothetical protein
MICVVFVVVMIVHVKTVLVRQTVVPLQMSVERVMQIAPMTVYRIVLAHGAAV